MEQGTEISTDDGKNFALPAEGVHVQAENPAPNEVEAEPRDEAPPAGQSMRDRIYAKQAAKDLSTLEDQAAPEPSIPDDIEVKIDGKTETVKRAVVEAAGGVAEYQKLRAGDRRLEEAAKERKRIEEEWASIQRAKMELQAQVEAAKQQAKPKNEKPAKAEFDARRVADKFRESIFADDHDGLVDAINEIYSAGRQSAGIDPQSLLQEASTHALRTLKAQQYQSDAEAANKWFETNYGHLLGDWKYKETLSIQGRTLQEKNPSMPPMSIARQLAEEFEPLYRLATRTSADATSDKPEIVERQEAKAKLQRVPVANMRQPGPPEQRPTTNKDAVAAMKAARNQRY